MSDDPIIEDIHRVRREIAAEFEGDVHALFSYFREREGKRNDATVTLEPIQARVVSKVSGSE